MRPRADDDAIGSVGGTERRGDQRDGDEDAEEAGQSS